MIEFARFWALALLPLPLVVWYLAPPLVARNAIAVPPGVWQVLDRARTPGEGVIGLLRHGLAARVLSWALIVVALAGPQTNEQQLLAPTGRDVIVAVDLSASMGEAHEDDPKGARQIDLVGPFATGLIQARHGDRVGLIAFGSEAYLIAPLTHDVRAVATMLPEVTIGLPGRRTDLGQAIGLTVQILRAQPKGERVLVMVSDGEANVGDLAAMDAARLAAEHGVTIHAVGFAAEIAPENARHMSEIAEATGGRYFEATDEQTLAGVEAAIDRMLPVRATDTPDHVTRDWTWLVALLALGTLVAVGRQELVGA